MYTKERIEEVLKKCLIHYTLGDSDTDTEEKNNLVQSVMIELDNSETILIGVKNN